MTTDRFDDELLSDVLEGVADEQTIAAVRSDPVASARLTRLETVRRLMAVPPPPAEPERRAQSIAAALREARTAPEVASLAPVRQARAERRRVPTQWIAVAAAAVVVILALPFLNLIGGGDSADTADTAAELTESDSRSLSAADDGTDTMIARAPTDLDEATADMAVESAEAAIAATEEAADDSADAVGGADDAFDAPSDAEATTTTTTTDETIPTVSSEAMLVALVESGIIGPRFAPTDPEIVLVVESACLEPFASETDESLALALLAPPDEPERTILVHFGAEQTSILDAEDCSPIG